jgi:hypothetical protein
MNITNLNISSFGDFISVTNQEVSGALGISILLPLFIIGVYYLSRKYAFTFSLFVTFVLLFPVVGFMASINMFDSEALLAYLLITGVVGIVYYMYR